MSYIIGWYIFITFLWWPVCWFRWTTSDRSPMERRFQALWLAAAWPVTLVRWLLERYGTPSQGGASQSSAASIGPLPVTSYGYQAPAGATAYGWRCTSDDCGTSEHEPVRRWPHPCGRCGAATEPLLDEPWKHDAEGVMLRHTLSQDADAGGGFYADQLAVWTLKEVLRQRDADQIQRARDDLRAYAAKHAGRPGWNPGNVFFPAIWSELEEGQMEAAADDLLHWLALSTAEDVENDNAERTNCRQAIDMVARFLEAPGGRQHAAAPQVRAHCLRLAEGAYGVLSRDQQQVVSTMSRA